MIKSGSKYSYCELRVIVSGENAEKGLELYRKVFPESTRKDRGIIAIWYEYRRPTGIKKDADTWDERYKQQAIAWGKKAEKLGLDNPYK